MQQISIKFHRKDARSLSQVVGLLVLLLALAGCTARADHALSEVWQDSDGLQMKYLTNHDDMLNTKGSELSLSSHDSPSFKEQQQQQKSDQPEAMSGASGEEEQQPEGDGGVNAAPPAAGSEEKQSSGASSGSDADEDGDGDGDESASDNKQVNRATEHPQQHQQRASKEAPRYKSLPRNQLVDEPASNGELAMDRPATSYQNEGSSESSQLGSDKSEMSSVDVGSDDSSADTSSDMREGPSSSAGAPQMRFESFGQAMHEPEAGSDEERSDNMLKESKPLLQSNNNDMTGASNENIEEPKAAGEPDFAAARTSADSDEATSAKQQVEGGESNSNDADSKPGAYSGFRQRMNQQQQQHGLKTVPANRQLQQMVPQRSPDDERDNFISPGHYPGSMAHLTQAASETRRDQLALDSRGSEKFTQPPQQASTSATPTPTATKTTTESETKPAAPQVTPEPEVAPESQQIMAPILLATTTTQAPASSVGNSTNQTSAPTLRRLKLRKYR